MDGVFIGQVIKQKREELGLSQEELCEGICSPPTLSRIENGRQVPSYNRMNALLQRLGLPENRYYAMMTKQELEIERLQSKIITCNINYDWLPDDQKVDAYNHGHELLTQLEQIADPDDFITQQFILQSKAILCRTDEKNWLDAQRELLLSAIHLTVHKFNEEDISGRVYSLNEIKIAVQISINYINSGEHKKAIGLLDQLLKYVQKHFDNSTQAGKQKCHIAYNYALQLAIIKRYEDALEIAELGRQAAIDCGFHQFLPGLAHIMAECFYHLGDEIKSKDYFYQAYYDYKLIDNIRDRILVEADAKKFLDINFPT